jgi:2-amino-4-hydroxy-6-hydroxymethyldihydropteridine diphosphokinase
MEVNKVYLSLGSNLGDSFLILQNAYDLLKKVSQKHESSNLYQSPPWGFESDNDFLNCCVYLETTLALNDFHSNCKEVEMALGKSTLPKNSYEDRLVDIDILFWNELSIESERLNIPHPRLHLRNFVLLPLLDLNPELIHPKMNLSIEELYLCSPDSSDIFLNELKLS